MKTIVILGMVVCMSCVGLLLFLDRGFPEDENGGDIIFSKPVRGVYFSH